MTNQNKYHVMFEDPNSGETLGLLLRESSGAIGRTARLANPYAAKVGGGDRTLSDLTDLSAYGQTDWRAGRGQDRFEEEDRFYDSDRVETRIKGQITTAPLAVLGVQGESDDACTPGEVEPVAIGKLGESYEARAQSFNSPGGDCTHVYLYLRKSAVGQSRTYTVSLYDASGAYPGSQLRSVSLDVDDLDLVFKETKITWDTPYTTTLNDKYFIVIDRPAGTQSATHYLEWAADPAATFTDGYAVRKEAGGSWVAWSGYDLWFMYNDANALFTQTSINPVRFKDKWYIAGGTYVYYWDDANEYWDLAHGFGGDAITDMLAIGGYLWVAVGNAQSMERYDGSSWADVPGSVKGQLLYVYNGYLYRSDPANKHKFYYTADGTTWSSAVEVGQGDLTITGFAGFRDELAIATEKGLWLQAADWTYQVLDWSSQEDASNGEGMMVWARSNELFIPIKQSCYRWTGATMVGVGPDEDAGLPPGRAGRIAALCGTANWLFAAIDAGASGYSSVMVYAGREWHEIYRSGIAGWRIQCIGYETIHDPPRLWFSEGPYTRYIELPDFTDNPYGYTGIEFAPDGEIQLSSWGSELLPVAKDWRYVILQVENCSSGQTIDVYYEIDRSGIWRQAGTINTAHTLQKVSLPYSSFATKTTGAGCTTTTIELSSGNTTDVEAGDWVRIDGEIRQIESITDSDTFVLALPLSSAPASGASVYASGPVGSEIRLRFRLTTTDSSTSPKLLAVAAYCDANVLDRWQITLDVELGQGMTCLDGSPYPLDAESLHTELQDWVTRQTPFTLHDIYGAERTVKVANAAVNAARRSASAPWTYSATMHIGLIEVDVS